MAADTNKFLLIFAVLLTTLVLFQQKQNLSKAISEKFELEARLTRHLEDSSSESEKLVQQHKTEEEKLQARLDELKTQNEELKQKM